MDLTGIIRMPRGKGADFGCLMSRPCYVMAPGGLAPVGLWGTKPDMRGPNEIDFWRGFALLTIFIDHVPGLFYENYTIRHFGLADAAELFVFLAGWSMRLLMDNRKERMSLPSAIMRLETRALTIFFAQLIITQMALALTAAGSMLLDNPLFLNWNNAAAAFEAPLETQIAIVLLSHQLGFFDILPLYVVIIAGAPLCVIADRIWKWLPLVLSVALYAVILWSGVNLPTWPVEGRWYFNPFAWQLVFVLGYVLADAKGPAAALRRHKTGLRWLGLAGVAAGLAMGLTDYSPDPLRVPEPKLFFMFDKTFVTPARILHLLALVALFNGLFGHIERWSTPLARFLSMLGRNSLHVFCIGSLFALASQFGRFMLGGSIMVDTLVLLMGITVMGTTAWVVEWRVRSRAS